VTGSDLALIGWPITFALVMVGNWFVMRTTERQLRDAVTHGVKLAKMVTLQHAAVQQAFAENMTAFKIVSDAAARLLESGLPADQCLAWMADSERRSTRLRDLCAQLTSEDV
jgi:hypothetical protein